MTNSFDLDGFRAWRREMNDKILATNHLGIKRFFNLDTKAYEDGVLDAKTKELLGLVASLVLRCNDSIDFHLVQAVKQHASDEQLLETMNVGLVVGGSVIIPHLRHAIATLEVLREAEKRGAALDL